MTRFEYMVRPRIPRAIKVVFRKLRDKRHEASLHEAVERVRDTPINELRQRRKVLRAELRRWVGASNLPNGAAYSEAGPAVEQDAE